MAKMLQI